MAEAGIAKEDVLSVMRCMKENIANVGDDSENDMQQIRKELNKVSQRISLSYQMKKKEDQGEKRNRASR